MAGEILKDVQVFIEKMLEYAAMICVKTIPAQGKVDTCEFYKPKDVLEV